MAPEDKLLLGWVVLEFVAATAIWLYVIYLVAHGHSPWWLLLAAALTYTPTVYKALGKRFGVEEES